jgi:hypothetical protein
MFDLLSLLSAGGWLGDDDDDELPDDAQVTIVWREGIPHDEVLAAAELAARIGHETIGLSPPITVTEQQVALAHPPRLFLSLADSHRGGAEISVRDDCDVESQPRRRPRSLEPCAFSDGVSRNPPGRRERPRSPQRSGARS